MYIFFFRPWCGKPFDFWQDHEQIVKQFSGRRGQRQSDEIEFPSELNLYLKSSVARLSDNPLQIWKEMTKSLSNFIKNCDEILIKNSYFCT